MSRNEDRVKEYKRKIEEQEKIKTVIWLDCKKRKEKMVFEKIVEHMEDMGIGFKESVIELLYGTISDDTKIIKMKDNNKKKNQKVVIQETTDDKKKEEEFTPSIPEKEKSTSIKTNSFDDIIAKRQQLKEQQLKEQQKDSSDDEQKKKDILRMKLKNSYNM